MFWKKEIVIEYRDRDLSISELELRLLDKYKEMYGDLFSNKIDKDLEKVIIKDLKNIDGIHQYYQDIMNKDILNYFNSQTDIQRYMLKGAFNRTLYLKKKLKDK